MIVWGQIASGIALVMGKFERSAAVLTLFFYANFALGGYLFWQALPTYLLPIVFFILPSGRIWGVDNINLRKTEIAKIQGDKNEE